MYSMNTGASIFVGSAFLLAQSYVDHSKSCVITRDCAGDHSSNIAAHKTSGDCILLGKRSDRGELSHKRTMVYSIEAKNNFLSSINLCTFRLFQSP